MTCLPRSHFEPVDGGERRRSGVTKRANSATAELLVIVAKNTYWCPGKALDCYFIAFHPVSKNVCFLEACRTSVSSYLTVYAPNASAVWG